MTGMAVGVDTIFVICWGGGNKAKGFVLVGERPVGEFSRVIVSSLEEGAEGGRLRGERGSL